jgi:hypothetical protein
MFSFVPSKMVARCMMRLEIIDQKKKKKEKKHEIVHTNIVVVEFQGGKKVTRQSLRA